MKKIIIELLIVAGLIVVLASAIIFAVDPAKRFIEARNAERWSAANSILNGYLNYTFNHQGTEPAALVPGAYYLIGTGADAAGCAAQETSLTVNLAPALVGAYLSSMPVDPSAGSELKTYYYLTKTDNGRIAVGACLAEPVGSKTPEIKVGR